jgi:hypothetical protein
MVPAASSIARRARRTVVRRLEKLGADREELAQPLELDSSIQQRQLRRMVDNLIIRVAPNGNYWLDRERWDEYQRQQMLIGIGIMIVTFGVIACLALNAPRHERHRGAEAPAASADSASPVTR